MTYITPSAWGEPRTTETWYEIDMPDLREDPCLEGVCYRVIDLRKRGDCRRKKTKTETA